MTESRLFGLSILPNGIHRSDTVGEINTTSVLKNWDASGRRKIAFAFDNVKQVNEQLE
jgi:hypothetical protein